MILPQPPLSSLGIPPIQSLSPSGGGDDQATVCPSLLSIVIPSDETPRRDYTNTDRFADPIVMHQQTWNQSESHQEQSWGNWYLPPVTTTIPQLESIPSVPVHRPSSYELNANFASSSSSAHAFAQLDEQHISWDPQTRTITIETTRVYALDNHVLADVTKTLLHD
ncbi:hypothetical protein VNI00_009242 [Paramarasmius palmivorus]|uniref:Uncharacterized protein n=1 Tax=Paramarasmius palmivorus TaxID=297713 RepID=A0AAW0CPB0_9AGAR